MSLEVGEPFVKAIQNQPVIAVYDGRVSIPGVSP